MKSQKHYEALLTNIQQGVHAHAYLFCGVSQIDKKEAALDVAHMMTGGTKGKRDPDMLLLGGDPEEGAVSIEHVRKIGNFISLEPYGGRNKVVIIDAFHEMRPEAASALLKILEEPPARSVFILISDYPALILPTILSRVQKIRFADDTAKGGIDEKDEILYTFMEILATDAAGRLILVGRLIEKEEDTVALVEHWISLVCDMTHCVLGMNEDMLRNPRHKEEFGKILAQSGLTAGACAEKILMMIGHLHTMRMTNASKRLILERIALAL